MARGRLVLPRRSGTRRQTTWVGPADQGYVAVASTTKVLIGSFDPSTAGLPKPTIVRTRGEVSVAVDVGVVVDTDIVGAFGICVISDQAVAAGAASVPGPFDQADWDGWFVWRSFGLRLEHKSAVGIDKVSQGYEVDSKGMRKVTDNETIVLVAESQSGAFDISMAVRMLLKLS